MDQSDISNLVNNSEFKQKLSTLATKAELTAEQDEIVKLQAFDSNYVCGKSHSEDDGTQNHLVFQLVSRYFKTVANTQLLILVKLRHGNQKDCLMRLLNLH